MHMQLRHEVKKEDQLHFIELTYSSDVQSLCSIFLMLNDVITSVEP